MPQQAALRAAQATSAPPQRSPLGYGPPAMMTLGAIVVRLNEAAALAGEPPDWDRWSARRLCESMGIRFIQRGSRTMLYATGADMQASGLWKALRDAHALAQALRGDEDEPEI